LIIVNYVSSLVWLRSASYLSPALSGVGIIMIVTTGFWASAEKDLKRLLAYSVLLETGFSLVMISFKSDQGVILLYQSFVPRVLALALLVYSLSTLLSQGVELTLEGIRGVIRKFPFATAGILLALFTIAGFPLFSSFSIRIELLRQLGLISVSSVVWTIVGLTGFIIAVIKVFIYVTFPRDDEWHVNEKISQVIIICFIILLLVLLGLLPQLLQKIISPFINDFPVLR
jgi:formate hydrogenlyase subunit 3/multisubunit Na+/H+ antiporter MnhD subunit